MGAEEKPAARSKGGQVIRYSLGRGVTSAEVDVMEASNFEEFVDTALIQGARSRKKDGFYFCAPMRGGRRAKENAEPIAVLALDYDNLHSDEALTRLTDAAQSWCSFCYTTASHDPAKGKFKARVLIALDRPAVADEYPRIAHAVTRELARRAGIELEADAATMKLEQPVYTLRAGAATWRHFDGPLLNVAKAVRINGTPKGKEHVPDPSRERIPTGKRNQTLAAQAGAMRRRGMSHAAIEAALLAENAKCEERLPDGEVRRIAASIARYEPAQLPYVLRGMGVGVDAPERLPAPVPITAASLLAMEFRPLSWCVPDILPEGVFILAARPKIGKSWLGLQIGIAVGEGGDVLGRAAPQGGVLYLALEDNPRRLKSRLLKLGGRPSQAVEFATEWPRADQGGLEALLKWCEARPGARLVIVDTLQRFRPKRNARGGDVYAEDYEALALFKTLAEKHRVTVLIVHHTRKAEAEDPMDLISGTLGLGGAADGVIVLKRDRGQERAELHLIGRDVEGEGAFVVEFRRDTCTWHMVGDIAAVGASDAQNAILSVLRDAGEPLTAAAVAEELGRKRATVRGLLRKLAKAGKVIQDDKHRYVTPQQGQQANIFPETRANA